MRSVQRRGAPSTNPANPSGSGRPCVRASYRGVRQATISTVNEITSAATAALIASDAGIGRSRAPPSPCIGTTITSSHLELSDQGVADVLLDLDHAGGLKVSFLVVVPLSNSISSSGEQCTCSSPGRSEVIVIVSGLPLLTSTRLLVGVIVSPLMADVEGLRADASVDGSFDWVCVLLVPLRCWCRCRSRRRPVT